MVTEKADKLLGSRKGEEMDKGLGHTSGSGLVKEESPDVSWDRFRDDVHARGVSESRVKEGSTSVPPLKTWLVSREEVPAAPPGEGKSPSIRSRRSLQSLDETGGLSIDGCSW